MRSSSAGDGQEDEQGEELDEEEPAARPARKSAAPSRRGLRPAEDAFMRFDDMEKFLRDAERRKYEGADEDEDEEDEEGEEGGEERNGDKQHPGLPRSY